MVKRKSRFEVFSGTSGRARYFRKLPNAKKHADVLETRGARGIILYDLKTDKQLKR